MATSVPCRGMKPASFPTAGLTSWTGFAAIISHDVQPNQAKKLELWGYSFAGLIPSLANAFQIQIMNIIYGTVAIKLTDLVGCRSTCPSSFLQAVNGLDRGFEEVP